MNNQLLCHNLQNLIILPFRRPSNYYPKHNQNERASAVWSTYNLADQEYKTILLTMNRNSEGYSAECRHTHITTLQGINKITTEISLHCTTRFLTVTSYGTSQYIVSLSVNSTRAPRCSQVTRLFTPFPRTTKKSLSGWT